MKLRVKFLLFFCWLTYWHTSLYGQNNIPKREITWRNILEEIKTCQDTIYRLENARIVGELENNDVDKDTLEIKIGVEILNCEFEVYSAFENVRFLKPLLFRNNQKLDLYFKNCTFDRLSSTTNHNSTFAADSCRFTNRVSFFDAYQNIAFFNSIFEFGKAKKIPVSASNRRTTLILINGKEKIESVAFQNCRFQSYIPVVKHISIEVRSNLLVFSENDLGNIALDLEGSEIAHVTELVNNKTQEPIGFESTIFYPPSTHIDWKQLAGYKTCLYDDYREKAFRVSPEPATSDTSVLYHPTNYRNYKAIYAMLLNIYKVRGDQVGYNACYVEFKDIETRKYAADYERNPNLETFFTWKLHQFLKTFCEYGTNPVKSVIYAFYVILCFSIIYILFPSEPDHLRKNAILEKWEKILHYFSTNKKLLEIHREEQQTKIAAIEDLRQKLQKSQQEAPFILQMIGFPFYLSSLFYYQLTEWFVQKGEISAGIWAEQSPSQRFRSSVWVSLYFLVFLISGVIMRCLNAIMLSINVFVTLGYGGVPATGIAKYLAVLEGLIGWFLLSIFSVSLISQVLN